MGGCFSHSTFFSLLHLLLPHPGLEKEEGDRKEEKCGGEEMVDLGSTLPIGMESTIAFYVWCQDEDLDWLR